MCNIENYIICPTLPNFKEAELTELSIGFDNPGEKLESLIERVLGPEVSEVDLSELGFKLIHFDKPSKPKFALFKSDIDINFIISLYEGANFYSITKTRHLTVVERIVNAYLDPLHLEEDLDFYLKNGFKLSSSDFRLINFLKIG